MPRNKSKAGSSAMKSEKEIKAAELAAKEKADKEVAEQKVAEKAAEAAEKAAEEAAEAAEAAEKAAEKAAEAAQEKADNEAAKARVSKPALAVKAPERKDKVVRVRGLKNHTCHIAKIPYVIEEDKIQELPNSVATVLSNARIVTKI